jgi:hypothetical protein
MTHPVRQLTPAGCERFSAWLSNPIGPAPRDMLLDDAYSDELEGIGAVDLDKSFQSSYDLGIYLNSVFDTSDRISLESKNEMWAWLSLAFLDSLVRRSGAKKGMPLARAHYLDDGPRLAYRLITRTAWTLVKLHGENAKVALGSARSPWGEMAEQMTASQEIFGHPSFWSVARHIFLDERGIVYLGVTTQRDSKARRDPESRAGLGGVHRLIRTLKQFDRTYNTRMMSEDRIVELLPEEFKRWKKP